jgi:hypothetical protein
VKKNAAYGMMCGVRVKERLDMIYVDVAQSPAASGFGPVHVRRAE